MSDEIKSSEVSEHYDGERLTREELIERIGEGNVICSVVIDKGHPNGAEEHFLTDTGIIIIVNNRTRILVTKLIARPGQLRRFGNRVPRRVVELAMEHQRLGYNLV